MKIKTAELTGAALDWAVLRAWRPDLEWKLFSNGLHARYPERLLGLLPKDWLRFQPSTEPVQGHQIIEREKITTTCKPPQLELWYALIWRQGAGWTRASGPTHLIAAMRCYVASVLGEEVDIPKELLV